MQHNRLGEQGNGKTNICKCGLKPLINLNFFIDFATAKASPGLQSINIYLVIP